MKKLHDCKVLVVGLGQIGGSLAYELTSRRLAGEVIGFDKNRSTLVCAQRKAVVSRTIRNLKHGLGEADIVILAMPIRAIIATLPTVARYLKKGSVCLDVAGTTSEILATVARLSPSINYVSGHPITGTEKHGIESAQLGLFAGKTFVLTPAPRLKKEARASITQLVRKLGARPVVISAERHDQLIAQTSHLPYCLALALSRQVGLAAHTDPALWKLVGGSLRSGTRVANSSPDLTVDMLSTNRRQVVQAIDKFVETLAELKEMIEKKSEPGLKHYAVKARKIAVRIAK
jgi:prephenate dehydrogenase